MTSIAKYEAAEVLLEKQLALVPVVKQLFSLALAAQARLLVDSTWEQYRETIRVYSGLDTPEKYPGQISLKRMLEKVRLLRTHEAVSQALRAHVEARDEL